MSENIIIDKDPERQRDGVLDVSWIRNDAGKRVEIEFLAKDDHGVLPVEHRGEEEGESDYKLDAVIHSVLDEEGFDDVAVICLLNVLLEFNYFPLDLHILGVVILH